MVIRLMLVLALSFGALGLVACGSDDPVENPDSSGTPDPAGSITLDAPSLLQERCTTCHSEDTATRGERDEDGWLTIIKEMRLRGAKITDEEAELLAGYLALQ